LSPYAQAFSAGSLLSQAFGAEVVLCEVPAERPPVVWDDEQEAETEPEPESATPSLLDQLSPIEEEDPR